MAETKDGEETIVKINNDKFTEEEIIRLMRKLLNTIEKDIYPLTAVQVAKGDRVFGSSIHSINILHLLKILLVAYMSWLTFVNSG